MDIYYLGKPTILPKENHYIVRGHFTRGGQNSKSFFETDFYVEKPFGLRNDFVKVYQKMDKNFIQSKRKYKNETEDEFIERCEKQINQRYYYFHYKGEGWCWDHPHFDSKGFFVGNPIRGLLEEKVA